jgi:hypothetical protein
LSLDRAKELLDALQPQAGKFWMEIGERLLVGQERYGGFKFSEYDLDQMAREEIEDFIVYIVAKTYLKEKQ